jgi:HK97 family phage portal protein
MKKHKPNRVVETTKAVAPTPPGGLSSPMSFGGWMGSVREPFLTAWQRNLSEANPRDPLMLAVSAYYACVSIISQDVGKLPLRLMRRANSAAAPELADSHPISRLLKTPNKYQSDVDFLQYHTAAKLIHGASFIYKVPDERFVTKELHILPPGRVQPLISDVTKEVYYQIIGDDGGLAPVGDWERTIPASFIIHERMNAMLHPLIGVPPIYAAATSAATGARIMMNSERFFGNMARPSGILTAPGEIKQATADRLKEKWNQSFRAGRLGDTAVLGDGLEFKSIILNAVDSQLIEQLRWTVEDVARVFRVPLYLLGDLAKTAYKNSEQAARSYYQGCLQYHLQSTERTFDAGLGLRDGHFTNFDLDGFFRMEMDARFQAYKTALDAGIFSINEVRAREGLAPVKGGEEPRVQAQYLPLSVIPDTNVPVIAGGTRPPADEPPDDDEDDDEDKSVEIASDHPMLTSIVKLQQVIRKSAA